MAESTASEHGVLDADRVKRLAQETGRAIFARLAVLVGLLVFLPQAIAGIVLPYLIQSLAANSDNWPLIWGAEFVAFLFIASGFWLGQAAVVYAAGTWIEGEPAEVGETLSAVLGNASALLVQGVIAFSWIGMMTLFLVVPGLMAMSAWILGLPVHILEDSSPLAAFRRSERLTLGHRPTVLGLVAAVAVLAIGAGVAAKIAMTAVGYVSPWAGWIGELILLPAICAAGVAGVALTFTAAYYELRLVKDGVGRQDVVSVFN